MKVVLLLWTVLYVLAGHFIYVPGIFAHRKVAFSIWKHKLFHCFHCIVIVVVGLLAVPVRCRHRGFTPDAPPDAKRTRLIYYTNTG